MLEYSRIIIERYCETHKTKKAKFLAYLVEMSYDKEAVGSEADSLYMERLIEREKDPQLKEAMEELDDFMFKL